MMSIKTRVMAALLFVVFWAGRTTAQCTHDHVISISGNGQASARPDVAILTLIIRSSAPVASDAVAENEKKTTDVQSALTGLGYSGESFQITPATILRAGGPYYGPNQPAITGFDAQRYVYVFYRGDQLKDQKRLTEKAAVTVDALTKMGASAISNPYVPQQEADVLVYALSNPGDFEKLAIRNAVDQAHAEAQVVAEKMGVQITGLCNASVGTTIVYQGSMGAAEFSSLLQQSQNPLEGLPYRYYSVHPEQVIVAANASLTYGFK